MKKRSAIAVVSLFMIFIANHVSAALVSNALVTAAGTYGDGSVFVVLDTPINETNCIQPRIDVSSSHPNAKNILATAYTALATGNKVKVMTNGCLGMYPTMDVSASSYFLMYKN